MGECKSVKIGVMPQMNKTTLVKELLSKMDNACIGKEVLSEILANSLREGVMTEELKDLIEKADSIVYFPEMRLFDDRRNIKSLLTSGSGIVTTMHAGHLDSLGKDFKNFVEKGIKEKI